MKIPPRAALAALLLAILFFLGMLFRDFVLANIIRPVAIVFLLFWRLVESVDQTIYWGLLIFAAAVYALYRLGRGEEPFERATPDEAGPIADRVSRWRSTIQVFGGEAGEVNVLRRDLQTMMTAVMAAKETEASNFEVHDALKQRQIPLPEPVYAFLFPTAAPPPRGILEKVQLSLRRGPEKWIRHWTGREEAEYCQSIEEVLAFMEAAMEKEP